MSSKQKNITVTFGGITLIKQNATEEEFDFISKYLRGSIIKITPTSSSRAVFTPYNKTAAPENRVFRRGEEIVSGVVSDNPNPSVRTVHKIVHQIWRLHSDSNGHPNPSSVLRFLKSMFPRADVLELKKAMWTCNSLVRACIDHGVIDRLK